MPNPRRNTIHFTPTQQRMMDMLSDGKWHSVHELFTCLEDMGSDLTAVKNQIHKIRMMLWDDGGDITSRRIKGETQYRRVQRFDIQPTITE